MQAAENLIKRHEAFITTMDANDEKINAVLQFANRLIDENHYDREKIHKKAEAINERFVITFFLCSLSIITFILHCRK